MVPVCQDNHKAMKADGNLFIDNVTDCFIQEVDVDFRLFLGNCRHCKSTITLTEASLIPEE